MSKREQIALAVASHLEDDSFVNVGIGIPGLVPHFVADERGVTFHAEHGVIGFGSDRFGPPDGNELAFFGTSYRMRQGGFVTDHTRSFALVRSGRLDLAVLGAFQVDATGAFAGFRTPSMRSGCPGGSPEIGGAARRLIVAMEHLDSTGCSKLVRSITLPVGVYRPAGLVVTELGSFVPDGHGFTVDRLADGVSPDQVMAATDAVLRF